MSVAELNWDEPRFSSEKAAAAIGCNTQWLTNLISGPRGKYPLGSDEIVQRARRRRFIFKFRTVYHLALIHELGTRAGALTLEAARDFSRIAAEDASPADLRPDRSPRYLIIAPVTGEALIVSAETGGALVISRAGGMADGSPTIVLGVNKVLNQVVKGLGL
ncbi:hypothetical protein [Phenylobacterium sp.]|uniref:hypothetical protein n=1 Tax=Phenylobacterium sp. TaxID=1871053 RepID=UPI0025F4935F|nr:hypothetical protein [Phenylobacterium sp.]MCA6343878.1 hypothetical protein [Phenylobacterium sp.]